MNAETLEFALFGFLTVAFLFGMARWLEVGSRQSVEKYKKR
jgi:hypothetical protein